MVGGKEIPGSRGEIGAYIAKVIPGGAAEQTGKFVEGKCTRREKVSICYYLLRVNGYLKDKKYSEKRCACLKLTVKDFGDLSHQSQKWFFVFCFFFS